MSAPEQPRADADAAAATHDAADADAARTRVASDAGEQAGPGPEGAEGDPEQDGLEPMERAILDLEKQRFKYQGAKERAIRLQLRMPVTEYYQRLNALLDTRAAWAAEPVLVRRLVRLRDA